MSQRDLGYAADITIAIRDINTFLSGMTFDEFLDDPRTQSAVIRQIAIVGEATKLLSDEFRAAHAEIPWRKMAGMRDVLVHDYRGTSLPIVWRAATIDLPDVERAITAFLPAVDE